MKRIKINNFKALKEIEFNLSEINCLIGENNSGKSSIIEAIYLFLKGEKITRDEFYNPEDEITIEVEFGEVNPIDLQKIQDEEHRKRIEGLVFDNKLILLRRYNTNGTSKLKCKKLIPKEERFKEEYINNKFKGTKSKDIIKITSNVYPELSTDIESNVTQTTIKNLLLEYIESLDKEDKELNESDLPTGIENSIKPLLPDPIYIPAVKDLSDDFKGIERASFGKLLTLLATEIEPELSEAEETFNYLKRKLNRIIEEDGSITDDRLEKVKELESYVQDKVRETFPGVKIEFDIPPPQIRSILSNAKIYADDGVKSPVEYKGDGFIRSVTFAILRSYVELNKKPSWGKAKSFHSPPKNDFIILFEEPELYLHPKSQGVLFDALLEISTNYQTIFSTHSPIFFSSRNKGSFMKVRRFSNTETNIRPYSTVFQIDLNDTNMRDKFQLISFETSNAAFFSSKIVLVEGDSELIVIPHIAHVLNPNWEFNAGKISLIKIGGTGSIRRYKEFFSSFDTEVLIIADLDVIIEEFDKLLVDSSINKLRIELLDLIDKHIDDEQKNDTTEGKLFIEATKDKYKTRFRELNNKYIQYQAGTIGFDDIQIAAREFFTFRYIVPRKKVLRESENSEIINKKQELLFKLRENNIFVLERGEIEDYYPEEITGRGKVDKALDYRSKMNDIVDITRNCGNVRSLSGDAKPELEVILETIFQI